MITLTIFLALSLAGLVFYFLNFSTPDLNYLQKSIYQKNNPNFLTYYTTHTKQILKEPKGDVMIYTPLSRIPIKVIEAFLIAEDKNFFYHQGIDIFGILKAIIINSVKGTWGQKPLGASTITQQLVKNLYLTQEKSFERKIKEAFLSFQIESTLSKYHILELYLNHIFLGNKAFGVTAAALKLFGKKLEDLTIAEIASLASFPKAPTSYNQPSHINILKVRRDWILLRLFQEQIISHEEYLQAKQEPIVFSKKYKKRFDNNSFTEEADKEFVLISKKNTIPTAYPLSVQTTLIPALQTYMEEALLRGLSLYHFRHHPKEHTLYHHKHLKMAEITKIETDKIFASLLPSGHLVQIMSQPAHVYKVGDKVIVTIVASKHDRDIAKIVPTTEISGAVIAIHAKTGAVLGVANFAPESHKSYNFANQAKRQPGSAIKTFIYLAALEQGFTLDSVIDDSPLTLYIGHQIYKPRNIYNNYGGKMALRYGLIYSKNTMTVRLAQSLQKGSLRNITQRFGIYKDVKEFLSFSLGSVETTLLDITKAYAALVNGGIKHEPYYIEKISGLQDNNNIYYHQDSSAPCTTAKLAEIMKQLMIEACKMGTGKQLASLGLYPHIGGKTGTTNDYKDAWFMGFYKDLVIGVWVGFPKPKTLGEHETGGRAALPIFYDLMKGIVPVYPLFFDDAPPQMGLSRNS